VPDESSWEEQDTYERATIDVYQKWLLDSALFCIGVEGFASLLHDSRASCILDNNLVLPQPDTPSWME
jgi:hypothetical protein